LEPDEAGRPSNSEVIEDFLRRQDGVVTRAQARRCGLSDDAVKRLVRSRRWRRCGPGVYFADDRPFTDTARIRATVWGYGPNAVASGLAAAWWLELVAVAPRIVEVTMPRNSHGRAHPGARVRRRDLPPADVVEHRMLQVTSVALTVVEAAVRRGGGSAVMDSALQRRVTFSELQHAHLRHRGRYGSPAARRLLQAASGGARSVAERLLIDLLRSAGITGWHANYPVGRYKVDVGFPVPKVAIEVDGWAFHSGRVEVQVDRERQNYIALRGWQVLRFTWWDLTERPDDVIRQIRTAISAR
jgi:very-short-patch-repair endonuclease